MSEDDESNRLGEMKRFLSEVFQSDEYIPEGLKIPLFALPSKQAKHFESIETLSKTALKLSEEQEVYFGVGLAKDRFGQRNRKTDIGAITCLWADLDANKEEDSLPNNQEEILNFLNEIPIVPSVLVSSGSPAGGMHAYWLLSEPFLIESKEDLEEIQKCLRGWSGFLNHAAAPHKWSFDQVHDVSRILRVPGTLNHKYGEARSVEIVCDNYELRYHLEDFEEYSSYSPSSDIYIVDDVSLDIRAEPPVEKFLQLYSSSQKFAQAWEGERRDLEDQSQSSIDMSLANIAALNEWTDQEIANLIIAVRRKTRSNPKKGLRVDYMRSTIRLARQHADSVSVGSIDISQLLKEEERKIEEPPPASGELLRVPGFISELMDFCLMTAPQPNQAMAFCGALALQCFLAGRAVRDEGDCRTNMYVLGLAHSASGKDWPRKINSRIAMGAKCIDAVGERFASGEGIQDALNDQPNMLFQTDEIDSLFSSIKSARDGRQESVITTLLSMYSSSNSIFPMRRRANPEKTAGHIDQPCLTILGTAIPNHYYGALSERMLTNGLFARMLVVESGPRGAGQDPGLIDDLPASLIERASAWIEKKRSVGVGGVFAVPGKVTMEPKAKIRIEEFRVFVEEEYSKCEKENDAVGTTVWGRAVEQARKLALVYACSATPLTSLKIEFKAIQWAIDLIQVQIVRMLYMANLYASENEFHGLVLRAKERLIAAGGVLSHSKLLKRMKIESSAFGKVISTLCETGEVQIVKDKTKGRSLTSYKICQV